MKHKPGELGLEHQSLIICELERNRQALKTPLRTCGVDTVLGHLVSCQAQINVLEVLEVVS